MSLRSDAQTIIAASIQAVQPDAAVKRALRGRDFPGRVVLAAAGKAAWQMARAAQECLGDRMDAGVVVTKYGHVLGPIPGCTCYEAGHPVPDGNSFRGTQAVLDLVSGLTEQDTVIFLLSGGHRGDERHPQAAVRREGGAVRPAVRPRPGVRHCPQRHFGGPSGHDRLRSRLCRPLHL